MRDLHDQFEPCRVCGGYCAVACDNEGCPRYGVLRECPACRGAGAFRIVDGRATPADCLRVYVCDESAADEIIRRLAGYDSVKFIRDDSPAPGNDATDGDRIELCSTCRGTCTHASGADRDRIELCSPCHRACTRGGDDADHQQDICPRCKGAGALDHSHGKVGPANRVDVYLRDQTEVLDVLGRVGPLARFELLRKGRIRAERPRVDHAQA
jgi:hypothetical protein